MDVLTAYAVQMTSRGSVPNSLLDTIFGVGAIGSLPVLILTTIEYFQELTKFPNRKLNRKRSISSLSPCFSGQAFDRFSFLCSTP